MTASAWKQPRLHSCCRELGKSRLFIDKECLLTDQGGPELVLNCAWKYLGGLCPALLLQGTRAEGYGGGAESQRNGHSLKVEVEQANFS